MTDKKKDVDPFKETAKDSTVHLTDGLVTEEVKAADEGDVLKKAMDLKDSQATQAQKIKDILKNNGMDSQQQINAYKQICEVLGW